MTAEDETGLITTYHYDTSTRYLMAVTTSDGTGMAYTYYNLGRQTSAKPATVTSSGYTSVYSYNPFRYRGYYYDTETGFYYLQSRYYDPATGRFLNADGYVSTGTGLTGYNMYVYCGNNPVMNMDYSGNFPWKIIAIVVAVVVISTGINHIVNAVNESKIDDELEKETYTRDEAIAEIEKILEKYEGVKFTIEFDAEGANKVIITNSHKVTSRYDRQKISEILRRTGLFSRESDNMSAEWFGHNVCSAFEYRPKQTNDVDLDYDKDPRNGYNVVYKILEIFGWE